MAFVIKCKLFPTPEEAVIGKRNYLCQKTGLCLHKMKWILKQDLNDLISGDLQKSPFPFQIKWEFEIDSPSLESPTWSCKPAQNPPREWATGDPNISEWSRNTASPQSSQKLWFPIAIREHKESPPRGLYPPLCENGQQWGCPWVFETYKKLLVSLSQILQHISP